MTEQVKKTGTARYHELNAEAKGLDIDTKGMNMESLEAAIVAKKAEPGEVPETEGPTGITGKEAASIEARLRFEEETRDKIRAERKLITDRAEIIAESESLSIPVSLPDNPTELDLARARRTLGIKKKQEKPSPETLAIESSKRGYYIFTNREQEDASHTVNLGGKYVIHLIPDQVHVLSEFHVKRWGQCAVRPKYERVATGVQPSGDTTGRVVEKSQRVGSIRRFAFEYLGEAPIESRFGLVTDEKILNKLTATV